jgi:hypothetical protein
MVLVRALGKAVLAGFYVAPWMWLLTLGALLTGATLQAGHFPTQVNTQPDWVVGFSPVYDAVFMLLLPALLSPFVVAGDIVWRVVSRENAWSRAPALIAFGLGCVLAGAVIFGNAFGVMNWLMG